MAADSRIIVCIKEGVVYSSWMSSSYWGWITEVQLRRKGFSDVSPAIEEDFGCITLYMFDDIE